MTEATRIGWGAPRTVGVLIVAAGLLAAFVAIELRSASPVMPLRIFRLRTLRGANIVGFLLGTALFSQFFLLSLYMQQVLGFSALRTGVGYIATTFTVIVFSGVAQALVTRFGVRLVLTWGMVLATVSLAAYTRLPSAGSSVGDLLPWVLLGGVGLGLSFVPLSIGALTGVSPREAGVASGLINTTTQIGGAIGLAVTTTIATTVTTSYLRSHPGLSPFDPAAITSGFHVAFVVLGIVALLGALAAWTLVRPADEEVAEVGVSAA
jgi:MFS family permease